MFSWDWKANLVLRSVLVVLVVMVSLVAPTVKRGSMCDPLELGTK